MSASVKALGSALWTHQWLVAASVLLHPTGHATPVLQAGVSTVPKCWPGFQGTVSLGGLPLGDAQGLQVLPRRAHACCATTTAPSASAGEGTPPPAWLAWQCWAGVGHPVSCPWAKARCAPPRFRTLP